MAAHVENQFRDVLNRRVALGLEDRFAERFERSSWAVFVEDEWRIVEPLGLTFGGRYENHDAFGGHFSPRAYLTWAAGEGWTVKGGVGRGYRTPSVNQLHDGINGATDDSTVSGAPNSFGISAIVAGMVSSIASSVALPWIVAA